MKVGRTLVAALVASFAALGLFTAGASAAQQRPFLETFGSAAQPGFEASETPSSVAVERASGKLLVGVQNAGTEAALTATFSRFNPDGTPAPFAALGTNTIDGQLGPGGKPCNEEPASCDKTPQGGLSIGAGVFQANQIAFDPTNGDIYITQNAQNLVDVFSSEGAFLRQLTQTEVPFSKPCGVVVSSSGTVYIAQNQRISVFVNGSFTKSFPLSGSERLCRMALGSGSSAGSLFITGNSLKGQAVLKVDTTTGAFHLFTATTAGYEGLVAVDPTSGNPVLYRKSATGPEGFAELAEFDGSLETAGVPFSRLLVETAQIPSTPGSKVRSLTDFAIDAAGKVYVISTLSPLGQNLHVLVYGQPAIAPTVSLAAASDITSNEATLSGVVSPEGTAVSECLFEYGRTEGTFTEWQQAVPCEGSIPPDSSPHPVQARISGLEPNGVKYNFRLVARYANNAEYSAPKFLVSGSSAETRPATVTGLTTATLNGIAHPEGNQYTECFFRWGLASEPGFPHTASCVPAAGSIPPDNSSHPVSAELNGLEEATTYRFQLVAVSAAGTQEGPVLSFETFGPPRIENVRASNASQSTAKLEAEIDPRGFPASYRFEWGLTASYGHVTPANFESVPAGTPPVLVGASLTGLAPGTIYHYRVVASGEAGTVQGADHELETLNSCGLPDGRCLELVSPREPGFVALPGETQAGFEPEFQAAEVSGRLAYGAELGYPGVTTGGEVLYLGSRDATGWSSVQYAPGLGGSAPNGGPRSSVLGFGPNLDCAVVASKLQLTPDPVARVNVEAGGGNLYRRGADGSYTLITNVVPEKPGRSGELSQEFQLAGMSSDCRRVAFATGLHYSGVAGEGSVRLYEWQEGQQLSYVGWVPTGSGEAAVEAGPGSGNIEASIYNAVSADGSRIFFTATSKTGKDVGKTAVFARIDGTKTLDVSQSPLAINTGAVFQGATPDGSRVYFLANAGLTPNTSSTGRDLYECHIVSGTGGEPECELTDLSVDHDAGGAEAGGSTNSGAIGALVGLADDGSRVYFIARGQLVPGAGGSFAENNAAEIFSLYVYERASGTVRFVGAVGGAGEDLANVTTGLIPKYTSRTSHDGRYLLFESSANITGYESADQPMVYLYDAEAASGEEALTCISCRQDGKPPVYPSSSPKSRKLQKVGLIREYLPQSLVIRNGKPLVFFKSGDALAPGGVDGEWGLYEWAHGQVFNIAHDLPGATPPNGAGTLAFFGASADGADLYFVDSAALNWENPEARRSAWDARVGGGFPQPAVVGQCSPSAEGSCQGSGTAAPAAPSAGSATFNGSGNVKPQKNKKHNKKNKKNKKHNKKNKKHNKSKHKKKGKSGAKRRAGK